MGDCCLTGAPNILAGWWHFFHLSERESSCFHSTVSGDDWWKPSEVHFTIRNERAFREMAGTPIYTFQRCIGELSRLQSEGPPIEPDKRTQSVWKSWHVPRWRGSDSGLKNHLATVSHLLVRNILSNCILQLPKRLEAPSFNLRGRWSTNSLFGFCRVHLFSHLISSVPHYPVFIWCRRWFGSLESMPADSLSV